VKAVDRFTASKIFQLEHLADFDLAILAESRGAIGAAYVAKAKPDRYTSLSARSPRMRSTNS
jgi:hypothetical protein